MRKERLTKSVLFLLLAISLIGLPELDINKAEAAARDIDDGDPNLALVEVMLSQLEAGEEFPMTSSSRPELPKRQERQAIDFATVLVHHLSLEYGWSYDSSFNIGTEANNLGESVEEHEYSVGSWLLVNKAAPWAYQVIEPGQDPSNAKIVEVALSEDTDGESTAKAVIEVTKPGTRVRMFSSGGLIESVGTIDGVDYAGILATQAIENGTRLVLNDYEQVTYKNSDPDYQQRVMVTKASDFDIDAVDTSEFEFEAVGDEVTVTLPSLDEVKSGAKEARVVIIEITKKGD